MTDAPISFAGRLAQLVSEASARPDASATADTSDTAGIAVRHVDPDGGPDHEWTLAQLHACALDLAARFAALRVGQDDRIAISLSNSPEMIASTFAAWALGATPVPVRWDIPEWEFERVLTAADPVVHVSTDPSGELTITPIRPGKGPTPSGDHDGDPIAAHAWGICSSGSTGTPKVILPPNTSVWDGRTGPTFMDAWRPVPRPQRILVLGPMYHANAFTAMLYMLAGDSIVVLRRFDAKTAVDTIERLGITHFVATPTMLQRIADVPGIDDRDLSSIDWILQGAAAMPPSLMTRWFELIEPQQLAMTYGMSEGFGITALRGDEWLAHPGSVGRGARGTEVRILGPDGEELGVDEIGDVYLRTPGAETSTYLGAPPAKATADGFRTGGDLGRLDADGYLYLADRRVDLIVSGGANVYPGEVEAALIDHPAIADVVVVGLKDEEWGRRVHAIIEPADPASPPTLDDVVTYAKSRLAPYKVPKSIDLVDEMPRSAMTKINRSRLIEERGG